MIYLYLMTSIIKILDCTLRDGGYYNNLNFSEKLYKKYFELLTKQEGINCIEIGFSSIDSGNYNVPFAFSKDSFINSKKFPKFNYALAIAQIGKAKQIYLAGFDGYDQTVDKLLEIDQTINLFKRKFTNRSLISITSTKYNFHKKSIHAY